MTLPGRFICIEGPSGVGKSTLTTALVKQYEQTGIAVLAVKQPSLSELGQLARDMTDTLRGRSLACLIAADRYHQLDTEILPALARGDVVICDRYLPSTLVLQGADGLDPHWLLALNAHIATPDAYIFLTGDPASLRSRSRLRGSRDRFHEELAAGDEVDAFAACAVTMGEQGVPVLTINIRDADPATAATTAATFLDGISSSPTATPRLDTAPRTSEK